MFDMPDFNGETPDDQVDLAAIAERGAAIMAEVNAYLDTAKDLGLTAENDRGVKLLEESRALVGDLTQNMLVVIARDLILRDALIDICRHGMKLAVGSDEATKISGELLEIVLPAMAKIQRLN